MVQKNEFSAVILAAGYGSRIKNITDKPKCLLKINNKSLLELHLEKLKKLSILDIIIVTGYKKELIQEHVGPYKNIFNFKFVDNAEYENKGNSYSMYLGLQNAVNKALVFDADLVYAPEILKRFVENPHDNLVLVGKGTLDDIECAKTLVDASGYVRKTIDKRTITQEELNQFRFLGEAIGIMKFSCKGKDRLINTCEEFFED